MATTPWKDPDIYSVEVFSPDNKASAVLDLELYSYEAAEKHVKDLKSLGTNSRVVGRNRWRPIQMVQDVDGDFAPERVDW